MCHIIDGNAKDQYMIQVHFLQEALRLSAFYLRFRFQVKGKGISMAEMGLNMLRRSYWIYKNVHTIYNIYLQFCNTIKIYDEDRHCDNDDKLAERTTP